MGSVTFDSHLLNPKVGVDYPECYGTVRYEASGITPDNFQVERDGEDLELTQDGDSAVEGEYGSEGFPVPKGLDATVPFTITTTLPPGVVTATHEVMDADNETPVASTKFTITVTAP